MVNKILNLSREAETESPLIVYQDLDLLATPTSITYKPIYTKTTDVDYLSVDIGELEANKIYKDDDKWTGSPSAYIPDPNNDDWLLADVSFDDNRNTAVGEKIFLLDPLDSKNLQNAAYNQEQRKKAHFKLEKNINVNAIKQSIRNIFSWMPGERIINPEFGSKLRSYLYQGITAYNVEAIMAEIRHCFSRWEPRAELIKVNDISQLADTEDNTVQIEIIYTIPSLSREQYAYTVEVQKSV